LRNAIGKQREERRKPGRRFANAPTTAVGAPVTAVAAPIVATPFDGEPLAS
jgi:hypothetical protein